MNHVRAHTLKIEFIFNEEPASVKKRRTKYSDEFEEEAVKLVVGQDYKISEAARNLGIDQSLLGP